MSKEEEAIKIVIPEKKIGQMSVTIVGDSPLVMHRFGEKARKAIRDKQQKKAKGAKEARNPEKEFKEAAHMHPDGGYSIPAIAIKAAIVNACSHVDGITKVAARGSIFVVGDSKDGEHIRLNAKDPSMREDAVRLSGIGRTFDLRYRPEFFPWEATFELQYNAMALEPAQILHLIEMAGFSVGLLEQRPEKGGNWGRFHIKRNEK